MVKTFITSAVVSKGFDGAPAVSFSEKGNPSVSVSETRSTIPVPKTTTDGSTSVLRALAPFVSGFGRWS